MSSCLYPLYFSLIRYSSTYTYCNSTGSVDDVKTACTSFVDSIKSGCPELSASKLKVHLLLHLPEQSVWNNLVLHHATIRKGNH